MKIGIDGYEANITQRVGSGQYAYQLLKQLALKNKDEYTVFLPAPALTDMPPQNVNWKYIIGKKGAFWTMRELPRLIRSSSVNIFFTPTHYAPLNVSIPRIISIMDLSYIHFPSKFRLKDLVQLKLMTQASIQKARAVCTISNFTKNEIINHYAYKADNVHVTYPGIQNELLITHKPSAKIQSIIAAKPYILFVGTIQPRKNIERLIEAFETIPVNSNLVLVGRKGWLYKQIFEKIARSTRKNHILYLDYVPAQDLTYLYKNAACLTLPSLYEGFGIPVVEAMSLGCLVVVSNTTSLPEVAGDAGIYVDPIDKDSIAQGLTQALQLPESKKIELYNKGLSQIKKFSWEKCAEKLLTVFRRFS